MVWSWLWYVLCMGKKSVISVMCWVIRKGKYKYELKGKVIWKLWYVEKCFFFVIRIGRNEEKSVLEDKWGKYKKNWK